MKKLSVMCCLFVLLLVSAAFGADAYTTTNTSLTFTPGQINLPRAPKLIHLYNSRVGPTYLDTGTICKEGNIVIYATRTVITEYYREEVLDILKSRKRQDKETKREIQWVGEESFSMEFNYFNTITNTLQSGPSISFSRSGQIEVEHYEDRSPPYPISSPGLARERKIVDLVLRWLEGEDITVPPVGLQF